MGSMQGIDDDAWVDGGPALQGSLQVASSSRYVVRAMQRQSVLR